MAASDDDTAVAYLRSPLAIRARCENILEAGLAGQLQHFAVELAKLAQVIDEVVEMTYAQYPTLDIPCHGMSNHLQAGGVDRVAALDLDLVELRADERARVWIDLIAISVLLGAGAGERWRYRDASSELVLRRSEGLAVATWFAFQDGHFSSDPDNDPLRVDATALRIFPASKLAMLFQVDDDNPLSGFDGRVALLHALGNAIAESPTIFVGERPGGLLDHLQWIALERRAPSSSIARGLATDIDAPSILAALLEGLAPIWPGRVQLAGVNLGDVWPHPAAGGTGPSAGMVPFHTLSQWLAYSLFDPLARAGLSVTQIGALTGLSEYRNAGLLVDLGVLVPKHAGVLGRTHAAGDPVIVEWRALTVALLDRVAEGVRARLGRSPGKLTLAHVLEGGTWAAGRAVAMRLRPDGSPPIQINSDGTVY